MADKIKEIMERDKAASGKVDIAPDYKAILAEAPSVHDVLARPMVYEAWLKKAQEALNG